MNPLRAGALALEPQLTSHAVEMFAVLSDPAIYEFENAPPTSAAALLERYARLETRVSPDGSEHWLNWVVRLPTGVLAGYIQATVLPDGRAYIAYELASRFWRQGIASTALTAVLAELASSYAVHHAIAVLKATNYRSRGLLTRLGFALLPAQLTPEAPVADELVMFRPIGDRTATTVPPGCRPPRVDRPPP